MTEIPMTRDFRREISSAKCWDQDCQQAMENGSRLPPQAILQNREELIALCAWMESEKIRSYLEIGVYNGHLLNLLQRLFRFTKVAGCDQTPNFKPLPPLQAYWGSSHSSAFQKWRQQLGHVDLVLIDGDHSYAGVKQDFAIQRWYPHRFLVFHDIRGTDPMTVGVRQFWEELDGHKLEIVRPHVEIGAQDSGMGLGIWWK